MLFVVIGPPAGGKSTWVRQQARTTDIVIDYDRLAVALSGDGTDGHTHGAEVKAVTKAARAAAIDAAMRQADKVDVYVIHSSPGRDALERYKAAGARLITVDPGRDTVLARVKRERPALMLRVVDEWYSVHPASGAEPPSVRAKASRRW